jgi:hypothetical protein
MTSNTYEDSPDDNQTGTKKPQVEPNKAPDYSAAGGAAPAAPAATSGMPAGMDPALWNVYKDSGLTPSNDSGTGFADWQYWQKVGPSQYDRLKADIAGTGRDQPTGTPGSGVWASSGQGAPGQANFDSGYANSPTGGGVGGNLVQVGAPAAAQTGTIGSVGTMNGALGTGDANTLYGTLQARAGQTLNVDPNDPVIKAQVDAYRAEQTRAARNLMSEQAERGGTSSNQDANQRSATEKAAQATAGFQGTLMANEVAARRQEIQSALAGEQGILTAQQQMALQQELANLDVKLRSYQFGQSQNQQESQFARTLAERGFEFDTNSQFQNSPLGS